MALYVKCSAPLLLCSLWRCTHGLHSIIGSTTKEIPIDVFFETEAKALLHLFIKKELLTKFDKIHYTSTNGSEKPSLAVSNNSNVLPPQ